MHDGQRRYLIQRKQHGADGNSFTYEAGPNATDDLEPKGGIDAYVDRVRSELRTCVACLIQHQLWTKLTFVTCIAAVHGQSRSANCRPGSGYGDGMNRTVVPHSSVALGHSIWHLFSQLARCDQVVYSFSRQCSLLTSFKDKSDSNGVVEQARLAGHYSLQLQYKVVSACVANWIDAIRSVQIMFAAVVTCA